MLNFTTELKWWGSKTISSPFFISEVKNDWKYKYFLDNWTNMIKIFPNYRQSYSLS